MNQITFFVSNSTYELQSTFKLLAIFLKWGINGGGMRSCRLRANDLSSYTSVDAGDELAK